MQAKYYPQITQSFFSVQNVRKYHTNKYGYTHTYPPDTVAAVGHTDLPNAVGLALS